ncbi:MAG: Asp-tRNA(Asn)/Glu-tRNA(Gln) amidotransferase subunit GatC [Sterolibacterium sp.]|nr:Asp-tRNA(Asn)/Glu-tRNA(Gln) amidotransferase subunit GatC [Sterolibacterium sp.]
MSLNPDQVARIARLARIEISPAEAAQTGERLNAIFGLIEQLQAVDTHGIEPMAHAVAGGNSAQRLREDRVTETDRRAAYQAIAPEVEAGLYLVPKVIE